MCGNDTGCGKGELSVGSNGSSIPSDDHPSRSLRLTSLQRRGPSPLCACCALQHLLWVHVEENCWTRSMTSAVNDLRKHLIRERVMGEVLGMILTVVTCGIDKYQIQCP